MSTNATVVIAIPEPCLQSWEEMPVTGNGRLCAHCSQVVTDFTQMSDAALLDYLKNNKWKCGQYDSSQLNRDIVAEVAGVSHYMLKWLAGMILLFSQAKVVDAQKRQTVGTTLSPWQNNTAVSPADGKKQEMVRSVVHDRRGAQKRNILVKGHFNGFMRPEKKKTFWQKLTFWQS